MTIIEISYNLLVLIMIAISLINFFDSFLLKRLSNFIELLIPIVFKFTELLQFEFSSLIDILYS